VLVVGYTLAFPGVVSETPLFGAVPSTVPWLYVGWHVGFPALLGLAWSPWPRRIQQTTPAAARRRLLWTVPALTVGVAGVLVVLCFHFAPQMPVLIVGLDTTRMTEVTAPFAIPIVVLALVSSLWGLRHRRGPERWASTAVMICLCDLVLTYSSEHRYSLGWYCGRTLTIAGALIVLLAMLRSFRRLKGEAVRHAATDQLTGVANRRTMETKLARELARAARLSSYVSALMLDLDRFKELNDTQGHASGDQFLQLAVTAWASQLRANDLLSRIGGDEFVIVLPDTDKSQAEGLVRRLTDVTPAALGVSIGIGTCQGGGDVYGLIAAADVEMYRVKSERSKEPAASREVLRVL
jgi:diguanylate cyclase (GGDEF)-like protein